MAGREISFDPTHGDFPEITREEFLDAVSPLDICESEWDGYICTRSTKGHSGPHVAASGPDSICAVWED